MKYLITESQVNKLILSYIGPLEKSSEGDVDVWKNSDGVEIFKTSDYNHLSFNRDFFAEIQDMFTLTMKEVYDLLIDMSFKLIGKKAEKFPLF